MLDEPGMQPLRQKLLRAALKYHEGFLLERAEDHTVEAELAQSHRRYANISKDIVKGQDQLPHLRFALARFEQLARQHTDRPEYQWQVAKTLSDIAVALWGRDREEATRSERSAIAIYEQLLRDRPDDAGILEDLATSLVSLGVKTASNRGGGEEGAAHMDRARDILQRLIELEPESLRHRLRLAELHDGMYDLFVGSQSRQDEAMRSSQTAIRLYEELLKRVPNSPRFKYRLGKLHDTGPRSTNVKDSGHSRATRGGGRERSSETSFVLIRRMIISVGFWRGPVFTSVIRYSRSVPFRKPSVRFVSHATPSSKS